MIQSAQLISNAMANGTSRFLDLVTRHQRGHWRKSSRRLWAHLDCAPRHGQGL